MGVEVELNRFQGLVVGSFEHVRRFPSHGWSYCGWALAMTMIGDGSSVVDLG
jgi:hypothetical protein